MTNRQAACDPCRRSKLSCDHRRPVCGRCEQRRRPSRCVYRAAPFQRRRSRGTHTDTDLPVSRAQHEVCPSHTDVVSPNFLQRSSYPNLGHFGSLSHVAIFNQIPLSDGHNRAASILTTLRPPTEPSPAASANFGGATEQVADLLKQLLSSFDLTSMKNLVEFWCAKGISLALAEPLLPRCVDSVEYLRANLISQSIDWHLSVTAHLIRSSVRPFEVSRTTTFDDFTNQFCNQNIRWETLGIFFAAVIRATFDVAFFPALYTTERRKHELRSIAARLNKCSLDLCISLDCLNDLQLVFHYENFIVQSYVDGDHHLSYYRGLGDGIAFLFALGYHENIQSKQDTPPFLIELRRHAFARIYSADQNVAIFLGRPPRMSKRFCYFQIPLAQPMVQGEPRMSADQSMYDWPDDAEISYTAGSRWAALCASIKEEILEFLLSTNRNSQTEKTAEILTRIDAQWLALPERFRLSGNLRQCDDQTPFELDFLVNTRLTYLQTQFILRLGSQSRLADPDKLIVELAQQMLALTVEAILLRDRLVNSGTGLIWKIAHYGLPAVGILLLAMLSRSSSPTMSRSSQNRVWQDLGIFSAEIQAGSIIQPGEPLYELLWKATQTTQNFLESVNIDGQHAHFGNTIELQEDSAVDEWAERWNQDFWNMETEFWQNLAEHPYIVGVGSTVPEEQGNYLSGINFSVDSVL